jgi:hypothetical protein
VQEVLLEDNAAVVRKVSQDIDLTIEQAQQRYRDATQEVGGAKECRSASCGGGVLRYPIPKQEVGGAKECRSASCGGGVLRYPMPKWLLFLHLWGVVFTACVVFSFAYLILFLQRREVCGCEGDCVWPMKQR